MTFYSNAIRVTDYIHGSL